MNCCNFKKWLVFGRDILTAAFDGGCHCSLLLELHCFGFCMCVSGQPEAQTSSSAAVISKYSRGIYHTFVVEVLKAN